MRRSTNAAIRPKVGVRVEPRRSIRPRPTVGRLRELAAAAVVVVVADQASKLVGHQADTILAEPVHNPELALGIIGGPPPILILTMTAALIIFGAYLIHLMNQGRIPPLVIALLVGGAVGNLIDRILLGSVRDFIPTPWLIFNIADVALVLGIIGYLATITVAGRHSPIRRRQAETA